jgi:hypothetical protein
MALHGLLRDNFTFVYLGDVSTSQETYLRASTACYGDSLVFKFGRYATNRKVAGSRPDEANDFYQFT